MTLKLEPVPESAHAARRWIAAELTGWGHPNNVELAVLLTSEVVTNAILHGGPHREGEMLHLAVERTDEVARIEVTDCSISLPVIGDGAGGKPSGRGLLLLDALASRWGADRHRTGKTVWFEMSA